MVEMAVLEGLDPAELEGDGVESLQVAAGAIVVGQDDHADAVYFVRSGLARVVRSGDGGDETLARVGPGQCFGELGVVRRAPRDASVLAETDLSLLRVPASRFLDWRDRHPAIADLLTTLTRAYTAQDGRLLTVYRGTYEGRPAIATVHGDPEGSAIVSTKPLGEDVIVLTRQGTHAELVESFEFPDGRGRRELHLAADEPDTDAFRLCGVVERGITDELGAFYRRLLDDRPVSRRDLLAFRRTGFLGGQTPRGGLCRCLDVDVPDARVLARNEPLTYDLLRNSLGVGLICGGCEPRIRAWIADDRSDATPEGDTPEAATSSSRLVARAPTFAYDSDQLGRIRAEPELHMLALASMNSPPGERLLIATLGEAEPLVSDPVLCADVGVFLTQEANHIFNHERLNEVLVGEVFPDVGSLEGLGERTFAGFREATLPVRLAICAAAEFFADTLFARFVRLYYESGERLHHDDAVNDALTRSGVGELFAWHAREELEHRHVAFDVQRDLGVGYRTRVAGLPLLLAALSRAGLPVLTDLRKTTGAARRPYLHAAFVRPGLVRGHGGALLRYLSPSFHPEAMDYEFLPRLRADTDHHPTA